MPVFNGRYQYLDERSSPVEVGVCRLSFDEVALKLVPERGAPLALDLGDIDEFAPGDYELRLKLYTGNGILLTHFGKSFQDLNREFLDAYRRRLVQCLLLDDLEEITRLEGFAQLDSEARRFSDRCEIRLYKSNIGILPFAATGFQWRLADIDAVDFDETTYTLGLRSGTDRLILTRLAKRTSELRQKLQTAMNAMSERNAGIVHSLFPFLTPDQFRLVAGMMREGRAVQLSRLQSIHPKSGQSLITNAVDNNLKPYFDYLRTLTVDEGIYGGFKVIRKEDQDREEDADVPETEAGAHAAPERAEESPDEHTKPREGDQSTANTGEEEEPVLYFFFFVLRPPSTPDARTNIVAWEVASRGGRATYFFKLGVREQKSFSPDPAPASALNDASVNSLSRALALLNFRREPIYLPPDSLEIQPRYRRYAIASRKIPVLREMRTSFLGRAIHSTPQAWQKQVDAILSKQQS